MMTGAAIRTMLSPHLAYMVRDRLINGLGCTAVAGLAAHMKWQTEAPCRLGLLYRLGRGSGLALRSGQINRLALRRA
jgi:hypothetical protein